MEHRKRIKVIIIILAVLLALSLCALAGTLLYDKLAGSADGTVSVPDNLITPDEDETVPPTTAPDAEETTEQDTDATEATEPTEAPETTAPTTPPQSGAQPERKAATISLYDRQPQDNTPFVAENMFPGDSETKYFCVQVSHQGTVTVHFRANVRAGYEKLAEVLKLRVRLLTTGETLYDGLMRDMPASVIHKLTSNAQTTDELYYELTASLDTSVGNEYQNQSLIADFDWWVEETDSLTPAPDTGDHSHLIVWAGLAAACAVAIFVLVRKRKGDGENA